MLVCLTCELTETLFETKPSREHATYLLTLTNRKVNVEFSNYLNEGIFNFFKKERPPSRSILAPNPNKFKSQSLFWQMLTQVPAEQKSFLTFNGFFTNITSHLASQLASQSVRQLVCQSASQSFSQLASHSISLTGVCLQVIM